MAIRSHHTVAWKERLSSALTAQPQATMVLIRRTAVPESTARRLLAELVQEGVALQTLMPRTTPSGPRPLGWYRRPEHR